jgi:hypothetical protein
VGISTIIPIPDANAIPWQYAAQNITTADTVDMLDYYVQGVYKSSPDNSKTPYGCEINGLASLTCGTCILQGTPLFNGYGQCDHFEEMIDSKWWNRHRASYAARQVFAYDVRQYR